MSRSFLPPPRLRRFINSLHRKDQRLPRGFDNVLFSAKEERMLRKHQKNPDRRESDVDAEGNVMNNTIPVEYRFV
jgi:hypothetical protein